MSAVPTQHELVLDGTAVASVGTADPTSAALTASSVRRSRRLPGRNERIGPARSDRRGADLREIEAKARELEATGLYRLLRLVAPRAIDPDAEGRLVVLVAPFPQSTGGRNGQVFGAILATYDARGPARVVAMFAGEDPGEIFGTPFLDRIDLVVSHGCGRMADTPAVSKAGLSDLPWACSRTGVRWDRHGVDGAQVGSVLARLGRFAPARTPSESCTALFEALAADNWTGTTHTPFEELLEGIGRQTVEISASGPTYAFRDLLKNRGYRWHAGRKVWTVVVPRTRAAAEMAQLREHLHRSGGIVEMKEIGSSRL